MEHLSTETLARLVDEQPGPEEVAHLERCEVCARELSVLRDQTEALAGLPEILPPKGDWRELEARLRSEGLVQSPGVFQTLGLARTPQWMRAAAAVLLFLGGTATGALLTSNVETADAATTIDEAAEAMRLAEEEYVTTVARYREILSRDGGETIVGDPASRYAALELLASVSQAAVRQAPADPFLNGILTSALAERDAMIRMASNSGNWF